MVRTYNRSHPKSSALVLAGLLAAVLVGAVPARTFAEVKPFSAHFKTRDMAVTGGTLHVRVGGSGPAVLLLHGFGDTGDMWQPLAESWSRTTPSSSPIFAAWDCRRIQKADTRRRVRLATSRHPR